MLEKVYDSSEEINTSTVGWVEVLQTANIAASLNDMRPTIPHDEVMAEMEDIICKHT